MTSGRPAATTEPKAISSTIAAPRNPIPSGLVCPCALWIGSPPSLISRPPVLFFSAAAISCSPSSLGTSQPSIVNGSVVDPIVPSRETRIGVCSAT
jgi:hypothetical protein